ncbi:MAG: DUF2809 domain-containing protein [Bryobacterales bacterium]|nr:DUF2809 domain-containing protein [Bryobacterales bacterium]
MPPPIPPRRLWLLLLAAVIAAGLLSRTLHTGQPLLDKYLGDALYAAMVYVLIRLTALTTRVALATALLMTAIELFQLTAIPAALYRNGPLPVRLFARLLGTHFSPNDLLAYAAGIAAIATADRALSSPPRQQVHR